MKGMYAVYRKEMSHYFVSPVAYIIVAVFLILTAYFFNRLLILLSRKLSKPALRKGSSEEERLSTFLPW